MEMHFLSFLINLFFNKCKPSLKVVENLFFGRGKDSFSLAEGDFLYSEGCFVLFRASFVQGQGLSFCTEAS